MYGRKRKQVIFLFLSVLMKEERWCVPSSATGQEPAKADHLGLQVPQGPVGSDGAG